jgi:hypothetical protein
MSQESQAKSQSELERKRDITTEELWKKLLSMNEEKKK